MMFATHPIHHQEQRQQPLSSPTRPPTMLPSFTPTRPSPLSPRRSPSTPLADPQPPQFNFSSPLTTPLRTPFTSASVSPEHHQQQPQQPQQPTFTFSSRSKSSPTYAQRYASTIANPMAKHTSPSTRRSLFLNRVKREREDGRFENRGEQLVLMEHVAEEKQWGEAMRRRAERLLLGGIGEEEEMDEGGDYEDVDVHALDEYLQQEQAAEMDLLNMNSAAQNNNLYQQTQPQQQQQQQQQQIGYTDPSTSFNDEEYDDLFMDLAGPEGSSQGHQFAHSQDMDMS
ncbi:hypothetical protein BO71DRAFT_420183 [Aspergillus ellipticus CBS 707.79]|uniref:Uncharacterized protein n=1 Tax=Aspergillus ellipticus CBS 707.79 TaxID=1448320 RepID=A0A319DG69_9EURO|nr:hypothetical protein BO71DRAFT_420183 [Aspergillus ellipticus CBS 707.79]